MTIDEGISGAGGRGGLVQGNRDCHNLRKFLIGHDSDVRDG